ncbi:transcriptional regulator, TetR family [Komagataeibacter xylinus E25]|nr:transcriptional regulator, TetR family [Komagataeibacter xylinus E25]
MAKGRPRNFDPEQAVAAVLPIFMEKGFEGATFGELIAAMGINPPSFYAAFGSKEQLFRRVIDVYANAGEAVVKDALEQPTAFGAIERLLRNSAEAQTDPSRPAGCLFVQGALKCSDKASDIRAELAVRRVMAVPMIRDRLRHAQEAGDESIKGDPSKVARYVSTVIQGLAVQAASGVGRDALHEIVDVVLHGIKGP